MRLLPPKAIRSPLLLTLLVLLSVQAQGRELKMVFASYTPPYVFQSPVDNRPGILVEIVQQALADAGHTVKPLFLPLGRGFQLLEEKRVDGITISKRALGLEAHYSDFCIEYQNFAIGLHNRPLPIKGISDLRGLSIIAFQKADVYLGKEFANAVADNPHYVEMANQENQVHMLLKGRIDLAVMDRSIFQFYRNKLISEGEVSREVGVHFYDLFEPSRYRGAFADKEIRDSFNQGLKKLRESGAYQAIYTKYIHDFFVYRK